jgi:hypothetical protein
LAAGGSRKAARAAVTVATTVALALKQNKYIKGKVKGHTVGILKFQLNFLN